jgi:hypothetical protein
MTIQQITQTLIQPHQMTLNLDWLTICSNDPNADNVAGTCSLLLDTYKSNSMPGMELSPGRHYTLTSKLPVLGIDGKYRKVVFEAGPRGKQASYRLDFNPARISAAGLDTILVFLQCMVDADPVEFFRYGRATRVDVALDLKGQQLESVIVRAVRSQKHSVVSDRQGCPQSTYIGTPRSARRIVSYDKSIDGSPLTRLRLEMRLKPNVKGQQIAALPNPFAGVALIPSTFGDLANLGIPSQYIADSFRIGGLKRAMQALPLQQRRALKKAFQSSQSLLPSLDELWASWPHTLVAQGLGPHLGALPGMDFSVAA